MLFLKSVHVVDSSKLIPATGQIILHHNCGIQRGCFQVAVDG